MVMDFQRICLWAALLLFISNYGGVGAGDIVHDDNLAPKKPGCENDFVLVKVQTWVDGGEDVEFVGVGARFGTTIVSKEKNANQTRLSLSDPRDCCSPLKHSFKRRLRRTPQGAPQGEAARKRPRGGASVVVEEACASPEVRRSEAERGGAKRRGVERRRVQF